MNRLRRIMRWLVGPCQRCTDRPLSVGALRAKYFRLQQEHMRLLLEVNELRQDRPLGRAYYRAQDWLRDHKD